MQVLFAINPSERYGASMQTRREQARTRTLAEIRAAALRQVAAEGASALSIRGVAREIGMSPAGLYRYYEGRDALLTDLLVDAYSDLADAVASAAGLAAPGSLGPMATGEPGGSPPEGAPLVAAPQAGPGDPATALLRSIEAYRTWAVANPARFLLIFGTPVPGYAAPEDGPTVQANRRMGAVFFSLAALAWRDGLIAPTLPEPAIDPTPTTPGEAEAIAQLRLIAPDFPVALVPTLLGGWALWHGLVTLEITGQLAWIYPDTGAFFTDRVTEWVTRLTHRAN